MSRWVLSFIYLWALATATTAAAEKNIVLVVADDLSPTLGCYGDAGARTPNLDRLVTESTLFRYAFCTTASCSPSRSVLLSGLHNHFNGQYGLEHAHHHFTTHSWVQTLPVMLARMGYRTARIGKHHNGPEPVYFFQTKLIAPSRSPVEMANQCEAFITADGQKPFFLYFATGDAHRSGGEAAELPQKPNRFGNRPNQGAYPGVKEEIFDPAKVTVPAYLPDTPVCRAELAQYYQSVSRVDQGLGRLVEILKKNGQWENTLFLFTSDHGMAFPGAKTTVYEGGLQVPLIVRHPGQGGRAIVNNALVSLVNITPTLLDFAGGLDVKSGAAKPEAATMPARPGTPAGPYRFQGRSFLSILAEKNPQGWDAVFASHTFHEIQMYYPMRVIRDRKYKLIWNMAHALAFPSASDLWEAPTWQAQWKQGLATKYGQKTLREYIHRPEWELYDIGADPGETKNLAADPLFAKVLAEYQAKLKKFQEDTADPWLSKWKYE